MYANQRINTVRTNAESRMLAFAGIVPLASASKSASDEYNPPGPVLVGRENRRGYPVRYGVKMGQQRLIERLHRHGLAKSTLCSPAGVSVRNCLIQD